MRAEADLRPLREPTGARPTRRRTRTIRWGRAAACLGVVLLLLVLAIGLVFAGSAERLAAGVRVAGAEVSGLTPAEAQAKLERMAARLAETPVPFVAGGRTWPITPDRLDVAGDWNATLARAQDAAGWPVPFRGLRRIWVRLFGADVDPVADVFDAGLNFELNRIASAVDRPARSARIVVDGTTPRIVPATTGTRLDRDAAGRTIVEALAGFSREPVRLPVVTDEPRVRGDDLEPVLGQVRTALSAPVRLGWKGTHWLVQPTEMARLLRLPSDGRRGLEIGGAYATKYFGRLQKAVGRPPHDATFRVRPNRSVRVVPAEFGRVVDMPRTAKALLAAALSTEGRSAELAVVEKDADFATAEATALGVTRELARYSTYYAGDADRIQNLRRAVRLLNGTRIAPGATFSFNATVGRRTEARGFRPAPVIVGGEYAIAVGGGVSQVATTVFNTAWEAGLKIAERTAHALYISRYPAGRDATVNYPNIDLKLMNDTGHWLVMKAGPTETGISVSLLGAPTGRRVVSEPGDLEEVGAPKVKREPDPSLLQGEKVVDELGEPARAIHVRRIVYEHGSVLYDEDWYTLYRSEPKIVRYGTIPVPSEPSPPAGTGTTQTGTGHTGTGQTTTGTGTGQTTTGKNP